MRKAEQRQIAIQAARSQLRRLGVACDRSLSLDAALAVLDDLNRAEPDLIASRWYAQATDHQIKLFKREWRKQVRERIDSFFN